MNVFQAMISDREMAGSTPLVINDPVYIAPSGRHQEQGCEAWRRKVGGFNARRARGTGSAGGFGSGSRPSSRTRQQLTTTTEGETIDDRRRQGANGMKGRPHSRVHHGNGASHDSLASNRHRMAGGHR